MTFLDGLYKLAILSLGTYLIYLSAHETDFLHVIVLRVTGFLMIGMALFYALQVALS